ncbi:hypothetical protein EMIT0194P_120189 [Pseudomonas serbica]
MSSACALLATRQRASNSVGTVVFMAAPAASVYARFPKVINYSVPVGERRQGAVYTIATMLRWGGLQPWTRLGPVKPVPDSGACNGNAVKTTSHRQQPRCLE